MFIKSTVHGWFQKCSPGPPSNEHKLNAIFHIAYFICNLYLDFPIKVFRCMGSLLGSPFSDAILAFIFQCPFQKQINLILRFPRDFLDSLTVKSKKYPGYSYAYNPCGTFKLGPTDGGCQRDVAVSQQIMSVEESKSALCRTVVGKEI